MEKRQNTTAKRVILTTLIFFITLGALYFKGELDSFLPQEYKLHSITTTNDDFNENFEIPAIIDVKESQLIHHSAYTASYCEKWEQSQWVAYELTREEVYGTIKRSDNFKSDPMVLSGSATPDDYKNSGFDRGHLAPAADMKFSKKAMDESFFMSNMSPQNPSFNRGEWKELEEQCRKWAIAYESIYIITGPILEKKTYKTIGKNKVAVPEYFYKVICAKDIHKNMDGNQIAMIAFIMPNKKLKDFWYYTVSVDEVEKRTGLDFFYEIEDKIETNLENTVNVNNWK